MEKRQNRLMIAGISAFLLLAFMSVFSYFNNAVRKVSVPPSLEAAPLSAFPMPAALYLDGAIIHFHCLDTPACFSDIDLGDPIKTLNDPNAHPLSLQSAYYGKDSMIYLVIGGSIWEYLVEINPRTSQVRYLDINAPSMSSRAGVLPMLLPGGIKMIHGKIIVGTTDGKIGIVQDSFSLKVIDLKSPIRDFIEVNDSKIAVIAQEKYLENEAAQEKVFLVDVKSGAIEEKNFNGSRKGGQMVTVDGDIHNLYWVSSDNSTLNKFDIQAQKDMLSVSISAADAYAYTTLTGTRLQYHKIWYYSRKCPCEGPVTALMMDMSTLKPVLNPEDFVNDEPESDRTFMIFPFGDEFLVGTYSRVFVVSSDGTVINTYTLPQEWVGRNYLFLEYRK